MSQNSHPLSHIGVVFRHVDNVDELRDFYEQVLGMKRCWIDEKTGATGLQAGLEPGPTFIVDSRGHSHDSEVVCNFETDDVQAVHSQLQSNQVQVGPIQTFKDRSALFHFTDPDGYALMIWGCEQ